MQGAIRFDDLPFFVATEVCDAQIIVTETEAMHACKVLRMMPGQKIYVTDGRGNYVMAEWASLSAKLCVAAPLSLFTNVVQHNYHLHLVISPLRNMDRVEWVCEKIVEYGVNEISFILCDHTIKPKVNLQRLRNIIIAACKQSRKVNFPILNDAIPLSQFVQLPHQGKGFMAHCHASMPRTSYAQALTKHDNVTICVGPEGDFSPAEIEIAAKYNFQAIHFGNARLRSESAALLACTAIYSKYEM